MKLLVVHDRDGKIESIGVLTTDPEMFGDVALLPSEDEDAHRELLQVDTEQIEEIHRALRAGPESEEVQRAAMAAIRDYRVDVERKVVVR